MNMAVTQYSANHLVDKETGFIENPAYPYAFDADKKLNFLKRYKANGLSIYDTCDELGLSHKTVFKHYHEDTSFREAFDEAEREYYDRLEGKSKRNALDNNRSVVERIFQLNAGSRKGLTRGKYTDEKDSGKTVVNIVIDNELISRAKNRNAILEAEEIPGEVGTNLTP